VELERALPPGIALSEIQPDLASGQVMLRGMARSFDDLGRFLRGLEGRTAFRDVYLTRQAERKAQPGGQEKLEFAVTLTYQGRGR
jgi:Tfp pilus assembly protein PilN